MNNLKAVFAVLTQFHLMNGFWQMLQNSSLVIILVNKVLYLLIIKKGRSLNGLGQRIPAVTRLLEKINSA